MEGDVLADSSLADPSGDMYCKDAFSNHGEYFTTQNLLPDAARYELSKVISAHDKQY